MALPPTIYSCSRWTTVRLGTSPFQTLDLPVSDYKFLNDGNILITAQKGFTSRLFTAKTDGTVKSFALDQNIGASDVSASGIIAFTSFTATRPEELWLSLPHQARHPLPISTKLLIPTILSSRNYSIQKF